MAKKDVREPVRRFHAEGLWDAQMARRLHVSVSHVFRTRGALGLPRNPAPRPRSIDDAQARSLHHSGMNDRELSDRLGVSREAVQKWRTRHSLPPNRFRAKPRGFRESLALRFYGLGLSDGEIGRRVGATTSGIQKWRATKRLPSKRPRPGRPTGTP